MKRLIAGLMTGVLVFSAMAQDEVSLPPEREPFKIIIEDVPEEPEAAPEPKATPKPAKKASAKKPVKAAVKPVTLTVEEEADQPVVEGQAPEDDEAAGAEDEEEVPVKLNCGHVLTPPKAFNTEVMILQIFLDRHNFSCGVIDGVWGRTSRDAMQAWQRAQGLKRTPWVDVALYGLLAEMPDPLIRYAITAEDVAQVTGPMPPTWAERAKLKLMGYETLGACVAEKFHTSERTLRRLNPAIVNWPEDLAKGTVLVVPNVQVAALEMPASLVISLEECVLAGFNDQGTMCVRFPCSIARNKAHLPKVGELKVINMAPAPNYTYDPRNYGQDPSVGKMVVPAGPRNPVGSRWIGLSLSGYGIHGTPKPNTVGQPESRGCFRLTNWNAEKLFKLVQPGTPVRVVKRLADFKPPMVAKPAQPAPPPPPPVPPTQATDQSDLATVQATLRMLDAAADNEADETEAE